MRLNIDATIQYHLPLKADILLAMEIAQMPDQRLIEDRLTVDTATPLTPIAGHQGIGRRVWTAGEGDFRARYEALVEVNRSRPELAKLAAVPRRELPGRVIHYLWPSRYCRPDLLADFASKHFAGLGGGAAIEAMADWSRANIAYTPGSSDANTEAADTFALRQGICRDFAHVLITMARGFDIPARMVSAYAYDLNPPDFHAVAEVYLDGGWYLVDPSGMAPVEGLARIGVGRDAADVSFMTVFGDIASCTSIDVKVSRAA